MTTQFLDGYALCMHSLFSMANYLHIDEKIRDMEYECSKKDEEIKMNQGEIEHLSEELKVLKENVHEDQELLDMINIHSSLPDFLEIIKAYMQDRKANPVYYQLLSKAMKFDFLHEKIGIDR
jgi:predicted nuclease with TOPRIM domain